MLEVSCCTRISVKNSVHVRACACACVCERTRACVEQVVLNNTCDVCITNLKIDVLL